MNFNENELLSINDFVSRPVNQYYSEESAAMDEGDLRRGPAAGEESNHVFAPKNHQEVVSDKDEDDEILEEHGLNGVRAALPPMLSSPKKKSSLLPSSSNTTTLDNKGKSLRHQEKDEKSKAVKEEQLKSSSKTINDDNDKMVIFFNTYINPNNTENGEYIISRSLDEINERPYLDNVEIYYTRFGHLGQSDDANSSTKNNASSWPERKCSGKKGRKCHEIKAATNGDEADTLQALYDYCNSHENLQHRVIYLHTKGSYTNSRINHSLRQILFIAVLSEECIFSTSAREFGDRCSVCSSQFSPTPFFHYVGNMWVAQCSYIQKLIPPKDFAQAKERVVKQMIEHTTPPAYVAHATYTTKIKSTDSNNVLSYTFSSTVRYGIENESWLGIGRYASEHYILSHPHARPCDVFSRFYDSNPSIGYEHKVGMDKLIWRLRNMKTKPTLNVIPETVQKGGKNATIAINLFVEHQVPHPWYQMEGRLFQYRELYPDNANDRSLDGISAGGVEKNSWLYDFYGNLCTNPSRVDKKCPQ